MTSPDIATKRVVLSASLRSSHIRSSRTAPNVFGRRISSRLNDIFLLDGQAKNPAAEGCDNAVFCETTAMSSPDSPVAANLGALQKLLELLDAGGLDVSPAQEAFLRGSEQALRTRDQTGAVPISK